ncbi:TRAP transporter small permease [Coralliovum pocilloporae]|uniref:TRAP transporter small permease n=1 Tax=Coralliovum pocilloporae TaxID=3066369 RepID=UPI003307A6B6
MTTPGSGSEVAIDFNAMAKEDEEHFATFSIHKADAVLIALFTALFLVVFLQFFTRYILNDSLAWTEEAARYLLILLSFAGAVRCQVKGTHIVLEFVDKYYGRALPLIKLLALCAVLVLMSVLLWSAYELIQRTSFQQMVSLPFPKYYLHAGVMTLAAVNAAIILRQIALHVRKPAGR